MCVCLELFCFKARNAQLDAGDVALVAALPGDASRTTAGRSASQDCAVY
jgi:hypothetical protein